MVIYAMLFAALVLILCQTMLCLKNIRRIWKFIPLILCAAVTASCILLSFVTSGWTAVGFWVIGCFSLLPVAGCGIGWLIGFCIQKHRK